MGQKVKFKRKTTEEIDDLEIEDGSLIYNIENGKTYMDYGNQRIPTGGGSNGGIYVGEEEPTDPDVTLWVDTPISETKASEIVDEYTESDKVGYSTNYINDLVTDTYSTTEVKTNKKWIDDKPIYRKVFNGNLSNNSNTQTVTHSISNIGTVTSIFGTIYDGSSGQYWSALCYSSTDWCNVRFDNTNMYLNHGGSNLNGKVYKVIVEYTKTTD